MNQRLEDAMESLSFINGYDAYFIYGDEECKEETLEYNGHSVVLEHAEDHPFGCFTIELYFAAPKFRYTYIDRFIKTMFLIRSDVDGFWIDNISINITRGKLKEFSDIAVVESDIYSLYFDEKRYQHFMMVMKAFTQELIPLGDWRKYVVRKNLVDEQNYILLDSCGKGDVGTTLSRLGMTQFEVTDLVKRYRYINVWAMNIAKNGGMFLDAQGNFYKHKSDNPTAKKEEFTKNVDNFINNTAKTFRLYEGSGAKTYQMYMVFDDPFIFMNVEYVLIWGGSDYQSEDVFKIGRILMMLVMAGETPERTVERYLSKRKDAYPKTLRHDLLEILNYNLKKKRGTI